MDSPLLPSESAQQQEATVNFRHYWHVILERRWLVITCFISIFALTWIYWFKAERLYEATARLMIDRDQQSLLQKETISFTASQDEAIYLQTQYKNLLSASLLRQVITDLGLVKSDDPKKDDGKKADQDLVRENPRYQIEKDRGIDPVLALRDDITIVPIRLTRLVDVKVQHPNPRHATKIAETLVKDFKERNLERKRLSTLDIHTALTNEAAIAEGKLRTNEMTLHAYAESKNQVSFEENENIVLQSLKQLQAEFAKAQAESAAADEIMQSATNLMANNAITTIPQVANNPAIQAMEKDLAVAESDFAELQKRYKPKHPFYIRAEEKVASLKNAMDDRSMNVVASIRNNAQTAKETVEQLKQLVDAQQQKQLDLQKDRIEYLDLKRQVDTSEMLYKAALSRIKEVEFSSGKAIDNVAIIDNPTVPLRPFRPRWQLVFLLGTICGLGISIGMAFFANYLDDSIKSQDDVETYLRLPFLGYVPNIKTDSVVERDLQSHLHPQSNAAEGFRTLRASISLTPKSERFRVLSVTSTIPSEGKSLVASNLAIVLAQTGLKTLLVDADLRRPSVHKAYQLHSPTGLSAFLTEELNSLDPITHKTDVPNLDVICCGAVPANPSELVGSRRMKEFINAARQRYDRVLLDSPPISAVSDPLILAAMSDGVVFVTKFNKIRREHARKSMLRLQDAGIHIVGCVLNDIDFEGKDSYYYSYYYYQNRYYASHYRSSPDKTKGKPAKETKEESKQELVNKDRNGH